MRLLVTGGTGFVGANVVRAALAEGHDVVCTARGTPGIALDGLPVEAVTLDLTDASALAGALSGCDAAIHCAGAFDPAPGGEARMRAIHVDAADALCRAAADTGVRRVVLCSSSVTVGFGTRRHPGDEDTPIDVDRAYGTSGPLRAYHDTKREAERLAVAWSGRGLEVVVVNPDFVVGAWDVKPTSGALIKAMMHRWVPVWPRGGKCFVDADDVAVAHLRAIDRGEPGRRYLLGAHNRSYREFMFLVADVLGHAPPIAPVVGTRVVSWLGRTFLDPAAFEPHVLRATNRPRYRSGRRAEVELGMTWTPLRASIEKAVAWFRDHP